MNIVPTDDVWIYAHASDQTDPYLRFWGSEGISVPDPNYDFSGAWACLKFDLSKAPKKEITAAKLVIWLIPGSTINQDIANRYPVEVRMVSSKFAEKGFELSHSPQIIPNADKSGLFSTTKAKIADNNEKAQKIELDLLGDKSEFKKYFKDANGSSDRLLGLALTSTIDPAEVGQSGIYKIYSRNADNEFKPQLQLTFAE